MTRPITSIFLATIIGTTACGKDAGTNTGGGGGGGEPAEPGEPGKAGGALELVKETFSFEVQRNEDQRKLMMVSDIDVPKGWAPDPKADPGPMMRTLIAPGDGQKSMFSMSNLTISATCHGTCTQDKFPDQIKNIADKQMEWAVGGDAKKLTKNEEVKPGVRAFVIEAPDAVTFGVTHWQPGWPYVLFCNGLFQKDMKSGWETAYKACVDANVRLEDPLMPASVIEAETANLAKCPKENTLTFTPSEARDGQPDTFGAVQKVLAQTTRPGVVTLYLANFDVKDPTGSDAPIEGDQRVASFWLYFEKKGEKDGDIMSGSYPVKYGGELRAEPGLTVAGGTKLQWQTDSTEGGVDIIARTPDKICGTIKLSGGNRGTLEGAFTADLTIGRLK